MSVIEMGSTANEYRALQAEIKALEEQAEALKQKMISEMDARQTEELTAGEYIIRWKPYEASRVDTTALKNELPDIAAQFTKKTLACRFTVS